MRSFWLEEADIRHPTDGALQPARWVRRSDELPLVGRVPGHDGVWVAAGYSGHGNVLGFMCGELVAQAILGSPAPELAIFELARLI
jgi:glycine/D-amino acid oxidase-like deaminating enzyme